MNACDPCAANPLNHKELRELGVFWLKAQGQDRGKAKSRARDVFVTRLHVRYDAEHFPQDLTFQETGDRSNFQARFVIRHADKGPARCDAAHQYREQVLPQRRDKAIATLANLTGWSPLAIRHRLGDRMGAPLPYSGATRAMVAGLVEALTPPLGTTGQS
jgi:hypothetical protein